MLVVLFDRIWRTKPLTGCHYSHYSLSLLAGFLFSLLQFPHPPAPTQTLSLTLSNSALLPSTLSLTGSPPGCLLQSSNTAAFSSTVLLGTIQKGGTTKLRCQGEFILTGATRAFAQGSQGSGAQLVVCASFFPEVPRTNVLCSVGVISVYSLSQPCRKWNQRTQRASQRLGRGISVHEHLLWCAKEVTG